MDSFLKYVPLISAAAASYMFGRTLIADVRSLRAAPKDESRPPWWKRPVAVMAVLAIVAWVPTVINQFNGTPQASPDEIAKAVSDATAPLETQIAKSDGERDAARAQVIESQKQLSSLEADVRRETSTRETAQSDLTAAQKVISDLRNAASVRTSFPSPTTEVQRKLNADDISAKIGVWDSANAPLNDLTTSIGQGYSIVEDWKADVKTDRPALQKALVEVRNGIDQCIQELSRINNTYSEYQDIMTDLNWKKKITKLYDVTNDLLYQISIIPPALPPDFEHRLKSYVDALKTALDDAKNWQADTQKLSVERRNELSEMRPK
jgi:hypothetical protein